MTQLAPIVLFTYQRLGSLKQTVEALQKNYLAVDSDLYIFSDAAKGKQDAEAVNNVRNYIKSVRGFKSITIYESQLNKGLATSIIEGVSQILKDHEAVIVLEDDLVSTNNFLDFMNQSLLTFKNEKAVFSVSGFSFNLKTIDNYKYDTYFLNRGWSWGWATWQDRWDKIDWEIQDYSEFIKNRKAQKNFSEGGSDLNGMLKKQMNNDLDSWAIRWFYNQYKCKGLTVYPVKSKILNEGFGENATHTKGSARRYMPVLDIENKRSFNFATKIEITEIAQRKFQIKMGYFSRLKSKIETYLKL
ncbi:MAG: sugar transferase [Flavobacterium sp.]|uniref:sugar transferase n=1 Tax=Flavobacterium sp. TaxID=239 RepID=UPI00273584D2|nr:sugar transferase [Flavobacterium sp.]MDP3679583.1 sugar transferase [Flavobacterium sp.]MDZ4330713.1 sugar transferase [Flavobacterium sp.]